MGDQNGHICPHFGIIGDIGKLQKVQDWECAWCRARGENLWLCLHHDCFLAGCSETQQDHSTKHQQEFSSHCLHLNLTTKRVWCYLCETEVFLSSPSQHELPPTPIDQDEASSDEDDSESLKPKGLTGLKNIGNTCYMNAAIQALSNIQPLTVFFRICVGNVRSDVRPALAHAYKNLMCDMWHARCPSYVVPTSILNGIRVVHPMFRGYQQQDTQEFLRCFMDQIHEELKEPLVMPTVVVDMEDADSMLTSTSDNEYETCDSSEHSDTSDTRWIPKKSVISKEMKDVANLAQQNQGSEAPSETDTSGIDLDLPSVNSEMTQGFDSNRASRSPSPNSLICKSPTFSRKLSGSHSCSPPCGKPQPQYRSIISDVFDGKILSSVQCLTCETVSKTEETFQDLSLPIPSQDHLTALHQGTVATQKPLATCSDFYATKQGWFAWLWQWFWSFFRGPSVSLHDCLAAFFSADELKGDNMYSCEKCKKLRNGVKFSKVLALPEVLCIHLKRFRHELMFSSSKISSYINFPLNGLDLTPFLHKDCRSNTAIYHLNAVICHHGTWGGGHYTTYALNYYLGRWYEFDDQIVTEVSPETVQSSQAYVLFFKKSDDEMNQKRQRVRDLDLRAKDSALMHFYVSKQWVTKFNFFAEPGPIDNSDFLCPHGGVRPDKLNVVHELYIVLPQDVWEYLHRTFGGGPACNRLASCASCQEELDRQEARKKGELETFLRLDKEDSSAVYALSMRWFRHWEGWVKGRELFPPGPVDNTPIVITRGGHTQLKTGSDYAQISEEQWSFFANTYGGQPEVLVRVPRPPPPPPATAESPVKTPEPVTQVHSLRVRKGRSSSENQEQHPISPAMKRATSPKSRSESQPVNNTATPLSAK